MIELEAIEERIKESVGRFLLDLQIAKSVNEHEFENIDRLSREAARLLKSERMVSKAMLNELYLFVKVTKAELPYMKVSSLNLEEKIKTIQFTFDLILLGESNDDYQPGVPRIR